jgi:hypothetical protein
MSVLKKYINSCERIILTSEELRMSLNLHKPSPVLSLEMFKGVTFDIKRSVIAGAVVLFLVYILANGASFFTGKPILEMFESIPYLSKMLGLTGLAATLDYRFTDNHVEANGSAQNSPGLNATGLADSAANPLRDEAPPTMATPYTEQPC